ncbi:hypothetical protein [Halobacillus campisalis]|uniref:Lipoprotein n=1 Tax=Halobacillus campisalis TaxID=435909 RepID=A0ABW2K274_9BACI|nr:hypothetical protein [Halobacillus campisalis]
MKNWLLKLGTILFAMSLLAACGGEDQEDNDTEEDMEQEDMEDSESEEEEEED